MIVFFQFSDLPQGTCSEEKKIPQLFIDAFFVTPIPPPPPHENITKLFLLDSQKN